MDLHNHIYENQCRQIDEYFSKYIETGNEAYKEKNTRERYYTEGMLGVDY